jgi:EAL domain-containing protein (putative c-di-GMP-specific phosphodiesterase class I)
MRRLARHPALRRAIAAASIPPGFLTVEVTESVLIEQLDVAQAALKSLKDLGVHLSLDDFGTGYSSLSYLRDLPFDSVKIDRSLIRNIVDTPRAADIPAAIVHMAHALDLQVIAEGIETREQAARLQRLSCDTAKASTSQSRWHPKTSPRCSNTNPTGCPHRRNNPNAHSQDNDPLAQHAAQPAPAGSRVGPRHLPERTENTWSEARE